MLSETSYFLSLTLDTIRAEDVVRLREVIQYHRTCYYDDRPVISDREFDQLYALLVASEGKFHMSHDVLSPTQEIARLEDNHFTKAKHLHQMMSLDNTYNSEDLSEFEIRMLRILEKEKGENMPLLEYIIEYKFDGLGIALLYEKGKLVRALTRGDGLMGEDITLNAREISNIPQQIPTQNTVEIRGEVVMSRASFESLNNERLQKGEKLFANPRNAASGSLRQLDPTVTRERDLLFFAYSCPDLESDSSTYADIIDTMGKWGFQTSKQWKNGALFFEKKTGIQAVVDMIHNLGKKPVCPFDIDGLVIKVNNIALWNTLGMTSHHPRWAISYKFPAEYARTKILAIHHSVGRTGVITPVAQVEPVNIMGVVVKNATLHNYDEVGKKDLRIGDHVFIHRAGEVIPEIIAPIIESRLGDEVVILPPTECPVCGSKTYREGEKIALLCSNLHCPAREIQALEWFVSKHGVDIDGLGPKQMEYFSELGWIEDIASIYDLRDHRSELLQLEGYREKSVENLLSAIENTRTLPIEKFIASLGIAGVGKRTAKLLAPLFHRVEDLLEPHFTVEELQSVKDIGPETAQSILLYFQTHQRLIQRLLERVTLVFPEQKQLTGPLVGMTFCVTGTFSLSRDEIHAIIEQHGGEVRTSVSAGLTYLLAGDAAGSKKEKAQSLGVTILDWDSFQLMIQKD